VGRAPGPGGPRAGGGGSSAARRRVARARRTPLTPSRPATRARTPPAAANDPVNEPNWIWNQGLAMGSPESTKAGRTVLAGQHARPRSPRPRPAGSPNDAGPSRPSPARPHPPPPRARPPVVPRCPASITSADCFPTASAPSTAPRARCRAGGPWPSNSASTARSREARVACVGSASSSAFSPGRAPRRFLAAGARGAGGGTQRFSGRASPSQQQGVFSLLISQRLAPSQSLTAPKPRAPSLYRVRDHGVSDVPVSDQVVRAHRVDHLAGAAGAAVLRALLGCVPPRGHALHGSRRRPRRPLCFSRGRARVGRCCDCRLTRV
jgi:hypothetical protein